MKEAKNIERFFWYVQNKWRKKIVFQLISKKSRRVIDNKQKVNYSTLEYGSKHHILLVAGIQITVDWLTRYFLKNIGHNLHTLEWECMKWTWALSTVVVYWLKEIHMHPPLSRSSRSLLTCGSIPRPVV